MASRPQPNHAPTGAPQRAKCEFCVKFGLGLDNHNHNWCYADPKSKHYKKEVHERRIAQAQAKGIKLPPEVLLPQEPAKINALAPGEEFVDDLVGALRLLGSLSEDDCQKYTDAVLEEQQRMDGLIATVVHESDGEVPSAVFSISEGRDPAQMEV